MPWGCTWRNEPQHGSGYNGSTVTEPPPRARCYRCLRPSELCYCADLPQVPTRTRIFVLQHPHERTHPFGTARLVDMCMPNASVHVPFAGFTGTLEHALDVPDDAAVLFPHPDADDLASLPASEWPSTLIAIDGTWSHAKRLYRENTWLHARRHVRLRPSSPSRYRIRREPRPDYVSTLEAVVAALRIIEPDAEGLDALLQAFDRMIDRQIDHRGEQRIARFKKPRQRVRRAVDPLLLAPELVVVYAEVARPTHDDGAASLVHLVAGRVEGDEFFEAILRPADLSPTARQLAYLRLSHAELMAGEATAAARERLLQFAPPDTPLAAWTGSSLAYGESLLPAEGPRALIKPSYCNVSQRRAGYLEQVVARERLAPPATPCRGRAGARLANALAVTRWLRDRATAPEGGTP